MGTSTREGGASSGAGASMGMSTGFFCFSVSRGRFSRAGRSAFCGVAAGMSAGSSTSDGSRRSRNRFTMRLIMRPGVVPQMNRSEIAASGIERMMDAQRPMKDSNAVPTVPPIAPAPMSDLPFS